MPSLTLNHQDIADRAALQTQLHHASLFLDQIFILSCWATAVYTNRRAGARIRSPGRRERRCPVLSRLCEGPERSYRRWSQPCNRGHQRRTLRQYSS